MNGDSENQESTEERTADIIKNSIKITELLKRDGIKLEEVNDYKIYPIADNNSPKLSADRFEYTFSSGLTFCRVWELEKIKKMYNNIIVTINEEGVEELAFKDREVCEEYIKIAARLWPEWVSDKDRTVMQFLADITRTMKNAGYLTVEDLYTLSEKELIDKIKNCEDGYISNCFKLFQNEKEVFISSTPLDDKYCVNVKAKARYIVPLVLTDDGAVRINKISSLACNLIDKYTNSSKGGNYTYFNFQFIPYKDDEK